jgi:16S rRNA (cytidine1402-2'-O)-methyltransferase
LLEALDLPRVLAWYRDHSELSLRDASRKIAADLGLPRSEVYRRALEFWAQGKNSGGAE